jgi:hypothetical protein
MAITDTKSSTSTAPARTAKKTEAPKSAPKAPKAQVPSAPADRATVSKPEKGKAPANLLGGLSSNFAEASPKQAAEPGKGASVVGKDEPSAPNRRKVIVADNFKDKDQDLDGDGKSDATHGDVLANGLKSQGFQTTRVDMPFLSDDKGEHGPGQAIHALADKVQDGSISTKRGDVVNMSFGPGKDPTFEQANTLFGFTGDNALTPQNLKEKTPQVQAKIAELAGKPDAHPIYRDWNDTQTGIKRLQEQGLKVVHAAGNDGPDRFSPGFLGADHQLSATDAKGRLLGTSANHSLTTPAQGLFNNSPTRGGGIDINGDGKPEFTKDQLSGGVSRLDQLKATKLNTVQLDDRGALRPLVPEESIANRGEAYAIPDQRFMFIRPNGSGSISADPDGSGRPAVNATAGTSFSVLDFLPKNLPAQLQ